MIGVKIDADSRYAVSTHVTVFWEVWRPAWMVGSTGTTSDCSRAYPATAVARTVNVAW